MNYEFDDAKYAYQVMIVLLVIAGSMLAHDVIKLTQMVGEEKAKRIECEYEETIAADALEKAKTKLEQMDQICVAILSSVGKGQ